MLRVDLSYKTYRRGVKNRREKSVTDAARIHEHLSRHNQSDTYGRFVRLPTMMGFTNACWTLRMHMQSDWSLPL